MEHLSQESALSEAQGHGRACARSRAVRRVFPFVLATLFCCCATHLLAEDEEDSDVSTLEKELARVEPPAKPD
ncbi:MAG: hypothetical protein QOJ40_305, partial [Verrucomicrobiota bacterium]